MVVVARQLTDALSENLRERLHYLSLKAWIKGSYLFGNSLG